MRPWLDTVPLTYSQCLWPSEAPTSGGAGAGTANPFPVFHTLDSPGPPTATGWSEGPRPKHKLPGVKEPNGEGRVGYPREAHPKPDSGQEGASAPSEIRRGTPQLGILLCLLATLGMVLATGLGYLHTHCCRMQTQVFFREPARDAVARSDGTETGRVRQVRENRCVWLEPNTTGSLPLWVSRKQSSEQPSVPGSTVASSDAAVWRLSQNRANESS